LRASAGAKRGWRVHVRLWHFCDILRQIENGRFWLRSRSPRIADHRVIATFKQPAQEYRLMIVALRTTVSELAPDDVSD
jgi:hypothetical protein